MSIANEVDLIIQRRNSRVGGIDEQEKRISNILITLERIQDQRDRMLESGEMLGLDRNVLECIQQLDIQPCQREWKKLQREFESVRRRFSRETINIAVIGGARQGKSRLLQTISGLDDRVIPAFTTSDCTGTTSMIKNTVGKGLSAEIIVKTEREMMDCVQTYLDTILGKDVKRIGSFREIADIDLQEIERRIGGKPATARLEHLRKYVEHFDEWSESVIKGDPIPVTDAEEIKTYVAQHNGRNENDCGREDYYKYLAVKRAEISCEFNVADAGKIVLQDTIGLGDTSLGIEDAMLDTVAKDSDAAIIIKRPEQGSGRFDDNDLNLYEKLHNAFSKKNMGMWMFWLINETAKGGPYGDNRDRCESVKRQIERQNWELAGYEIVDVSDMTRVNEQFLPMLLSTLIRNIDSIDDSILSDLNCRANAFYCEYEKLKHKIDEILVNEVNSSIDRNSFIDDRWYEFYNQTLMRKLKEYRDRWKMRAGEECAAYREYIQNILKEARLHIPGVEVIERELRGGGDRGQIGIYLDHLDELRTNFTNLFLDIDECIFDRMIQKIKEDLVNIFAEDDGGRMKYIRPIDETKPRTEWLSYGIIEDIFAGSRYEQFRRAFSTVIDFRLTVRGFLMHKVRRFVRRLEIQNGKKVELSNAGDLESQAKEIWRFLNWMVKETCEELESELEQIYMEPNAIFSSIIEEFYDRLCFSSLAGKTTAENLWKNLYRNECGRVWREEFKGEEERSRIYKEWDKLKKELNNNTRKDFIVCLTKA